MHYSVNFLRSHADSNSFMAKIKCISCKRTCLSNNFNLFRSIYRYHFVSYCLLLIVWCTSIGIVWLLNMIRDFSSSYETSWKRSKWTRIIIAIIFPLFSLFMQELVKIPKTFKTFLTTEITRF